MHELSVAHSLVEIALDEMERVPESRIIALHLRIGALSGLVTDALLFAWDVVSEGTKLQGAALKIEDVPVVIFCPVCQQEQTLPGHQIFRCPRCNAKSADIRRGRELELVALEVS